MDRAHVFISYVRENSVAVDRLANDLRNFGINVWLDRSDIMPGQRWKDAINNAIQNGAYFLACFSKEMNDREETHMHGELRVAIDLLRSMPRSRIWFIPVFINETNMPSLPISDHESLSDINAVSLFENWDKGLQDILKSINSGNAPREATDNVNARAASAVESEPRAVPVLRRAAPASVIVRMQLKHYGIYGGEILTILVDGQVALKCQFRNSNLTFNVQARIHQIHCIVTYFFIRKFRPTEARDMVSNRIEMDFIDGKIYAFKLHCPFSFWKESHIELSFLGS